MGRKLEEEVGKSQKGPVAGPVPLWLTGAETRGAGVGPTPKSPAGAFTHRSYQPPGDGEVRSLAFLACYAADKDFP